MSGTSMRTPTTVARAAPEDRPNSITAVASSQDTRAIPQSLRRTIDEAQEAQFSAIASGVFIAPFFLLSAMAGQLADMRDKARIIRIVKTAEIAIMVIGAAGLAFTAADALEWAKRRGARSGRVAYHYVTELAGRAGRASKTGKAFLQTYHPDHPVMRAHNDRGKPGTYWQTRQGQG